MARVNKPKSTLYEWIESILIALVLAIFIRTYFIQPFKIPSGSMRMTLIEGDHLFVSKLRYGPILLPELHAPDFLTAMLNSSSRTRIVLPQVSSGEAPNNAPDLWPDFLKPLEKIRLPGFGKPTRGDVIVFVFPGDRTKDFIKRLIGLPGDVIEIKDGKIIVNGKLWDDPKVRNIYYYNRGEYGAQGQPIKVPEGKYFVLGDNSGSSHDSRYWGFVDKADLIGKAEFLFWPIPRIRLIK